jgi:transcriptional regulator with XRE-family HTH domain
MGSTHEPLYRSLLARLKAARLAAGLTQTAVAQALGRPQSYVSKTESGERRLDPIELAALAGLYGKPVGFFVAEAVHSGASLSTERRSPFGARPRRKSRAKRRK